MNKRTIEKELELNGRCVIQTVGVSMEPLLHNRKSTVVIEKAEFPLKKYDVVLFRRPTEEYVLHRVVKTAGDVYIIQGDNCMGKETVPKEQIIGVMTGYYEDENDNYISCEDERYRHYLKALKFRRRKTKLKNILSRVYRKVSSYLFLKR